MSNLSKYAALHRMTTELNVEAESSNENGMSEDRQVVAAVGGAVMALGMGLAELATEDKLPEAEVSKLLTLAGDLAGPASAGFSLFSTMLQDVEITAIAKDMAGDVESTDVFVMGLDQVNDYVKARPKPTPLAEAAAE